MQDNKDTKARIIEAAQMLFTQNGYDKTSVNGIIDHLKLSKGSFYHYFESKEALLDEVINMFSALIMTEMDAIASSDDKALVKLNKVLSRGRDYKIENRDLLLMMLAAIYKPENLVLKNKMMTETFKISVPMLAGIIAQGEREGVFKSVGANEAALLILGMGSMLSDTIAEFVLNEKADEAERQKVRGICRAYDMATARILGAEEGSVSFASIEFFDAFKIKGG